MKVLVIEFGGADYEYIKKYNCKNLMQTEFGKIEVDELWNNRDVSTQITSQLITGVTWRESGVKGRRHYTNPRVEWLEKNFFRRHGRHMPFEGRTRHLREGIYKTIPGFYFHKRNYVKEDLKCKTLFDKIPNSRAIYVPSYNPEPSWALMRNILDPRQYPEFGEEGALDLLEKNFYWRKKKLMEELPKDYQFLMCQFQIIDSLQHLYIAYQDKPKWDKIEEGYHRIDDFAKSIVDRASHYDIILFLSENGAARPPHDKSVFTHYNRPFYSINRKMNLKKTNMRDFHNHILEWIQKEPHSAKLKI